MMNKIYKVLALLTLNIGFLFGYAEAAQSLDGIAVVVNDTIITQSEVSHAAALLKKQLQSANTAIPSNEAIRKQALDQLINRKLQLQIAEQMGIKVTDAEINQALKNIAQQNQVSVAELYQKVSEQSGMSTAEYRQELRDEIIIDRLQQQEVGSRINITPDEVKEMMHSQTWQTFNNKEYHLEDLLVAIPDTPSPTDIANAKKRADILANKLRQGTSFSELSSAESSNDSSIQGGDLGWRKLAEVPTAFANIVSNMQQGAIAGPIQTPNGFHIIHIVGVRNATKETTHMNEKQAQQQLFQRKYEAALQVWLRKIRSEAFIKYSS